MKTNSNDLIISAKEHFHHLYPQVVTIDISIERLVNRCFECKIILTTIHERFYASKKEQGYKKSLDKCILAMNKQLHKIKKNKIHGHHEAILFESNLQQPLKEGIV